MKLLLQLLLVLGMSSFNHLLFGQTKNSEANQFNYRGKQIQLDKKVIQHFDEENLNRLKEVDPDHLLYLNYYVAHAYSIKDVSAKAASESYKRLKDLKLVTKSQAPSCTPSNHNTINILSYEITLQDEMQVILTGYNNEAIIMKSKKDFLVEYNAYRNQYLK